MKIRDTIIEALTGGLYYSGCYRLFQPFFSGLGCIFALHKVCTRTDWNQFGPVNRYLSISADLFVAIIETLIALDYEIVTISEVQSRLESGRSDRRFACLTFDDGYRDNYEVAYQIIRRCHVPIVVYITTGMIDDSTSCWWRALEQLIASRDRIYVPNGRKAEMAKTSSEREKMTCYQRLSAIAAAAQPDELNVLLKRLAEENGFDIYHALASLMLDWRLIDEMQQSGLVEFGAHTVHHSSLSLLTDSEVEKEMAGSASQLATQLGLPVKHFSYPFGTPQHAGEREFRICRDLGFATAVTTRHAVLTSYNYRNMHSLPRLTLNGHHATLGNVKVFASGATMALRKGLDLVRA